MRKRHFARHWRIPSQIVYFHSDQIGSPRSICPASLMTERHHLNCCVEVLEKRLQDRQFSDPPPCFEGSDLIGAAQSIRFLPFFLRAMTIRATRGVVSR